ncbi:MAG TPA: GAF domain-containing protein [Solirubrobacteraceae bacterium]|nr:GAF domain-containing protein [Solirubrobacteraceae bacterium]
MADTLRDLADGWKVGAEDFLAAVLRAAAQPIWVVDPDGVIRFANPAAVAALGYDSAHELLGRHSHETIHYQHPDGTAYPAAECPMLLPRATGETIASDLDWFFRRDGSMFAVSYVSVPIDMPEGRGAVVAFTDIEDRLRAEQVLREHDAILAAEQDALRRVAVLVARGAPSAEVFAAVAREVAQVLELPLVEMSRYEPDGTATVIGAWSERRHPFQAGTRWALDESTISARVRQTGRPARIDDLADVRGTIADAVRATGIRSGAGAPIIVDGTVWGVMATGATDRERLPPNVEDRLAAFTELVATAVSNTQAREDLRRLADEQASLRRVATLVARGAPPAEVFAAVVSEVAQNLDLPLVEMCRYEPDGTATVIGASGEHPFQPGTNWALDGLSLTALVWQTGQPARIEDYANVRGTIGDAARSAGVHAGVGAPIVLDGKLWGVVSAGGGNNVPLPPDAEARLGQFTELVATALSNTQAREDLQRLVDEQAALRRIATLVAQGTESQTIFDAVAEETGRLFAATSVNLARFTPDGVNLTMAGWSLRDVHLPTATRLALDGESINAVVRRTAAPARCDSYEDATGELADLLRRRGIRSEVGAPVVVEGQVWGALIAGTDEPEPLPAGTEHRLAGFAELIATAVSNATARSELIASRARIVEAADEQRRRVVRDLHDGAQQRLVHAVMTLQLAHGRGDAAPETERRVGEALEHTRAAIEELRELARGIHPAVLTHRGLAAAVEALADRAPLPVDVDIPEQRYPAPVESAAYFIAAEALTNVAKYSRASTARITATHSGDRLVLTIEDDGAGGASPSPGSGLSGLEDRLAALDGTLTVDSPPGAGTRIRADIPLRPAGASDATASR